MYIAKVVAIKFSDWQKVTRTVCIEPASTGFPGQMLQMAEQMYFRRIKCFS